MGATEKRLSRRRVGRGMGVMGVGICEGKVPERGYFRRRLSRGEGFVECPRSKVGWNGLYPSTL